MSRKVLIENGAQDATGDAYWSDGNDAVFSFLGTFGGALVSIELSLDGSTWGITHNSDGEDVKFTEQVIDGYAIRIPSHYSVRCVISGGDGTTDITVYMVQ